MPNTENSDLDLQRELQDLKLALAEREQSLRQAQSELERVRAAQQEQAAELVSSRLEALLTDLAPAVVQILTQSHLLEAQQKPIRAIDVLSVAKRLIKGLERYGLQVQSAAGETVLFDPNNHLPLDSSGGLEPGQSVIIRIPGLSYHNKVIRKAAVETVTQEGAALNTKES